MRYYIYKIYKPDTELLYIGSTNKISSRKSHHKKNTNNRVKKAYHRVLYKTIRDNGGWEAFVFTILEELEVETVQEARIKELEYINHLKPSLNMISPLAQSSKMIPPSAQSSKMIPPTLQRFTGPKPLDIIGPL